MTKSDSEGASVTWIYGFSPEKLELLDMLAPTELEALSRDGEAARKFAILQSRSSGSSTTTRLLQLLTSFPQTGAKSSAGVSDQPWARIRHYPRIESFGSSKADASKGC